MAFYISLSWASAFVQAQTPAPAEQLKYAVIVTRHGVRAPTWTTERLNQYSAEPWPDWGVAPGELTQHGRQLMQLMGAYYRGYFAAAKLLDKSGCDSLLRVHFIADNGQRTRETAKALAQGMFPGCPAGIHAKPEDETDPLFNPLESGLATADSKLSLAAVRGRIGPSLDVIVDVNRPALDVLDNVLRGTGKPAKSIFDEPAALTSGKGGVAMEGPLRLASTFTENFLLEYTNGMSGAQFGWGRLDRAKLIQIMALHTGYADLMRRTPYLARARGSNLLSHILRSMEQAVEGKAKDGGLGTPENTVVIVSGHDTNISNLSGMLGLSWLLPGYQHDDVPPGGALVFSLWRSSASGRFSVRLQFVAQTL